MSLGFTQGYLRYGLLLLAAWCMGCACNAQTIITFAGSGIAGYNGDDEPATLTQLWSPAGITVSGGNVYFADGLNNRIRKITAAGTFSTVTGMDDPGFGGDGGPATDAQLNDPEGVAIDAAGNTYIADKFNNRIRKITTKGMISTFAGNGEQGYSGDGGPASAAQLNAPIAVTADKAGNIYVVDAGNNCIRKITNGKIMTIAGTGRGGYNSDTVLATAAQLNAPKSIAVDSAGNVYIADAMNYRIRKVTPAGAISTVSGSDTSGYAGDGGKASAAKLNLPSGVAVDKLGNLFIADLGNNCIRKIDTAGVISTVAGGGAASGLNAPYGIVPDGAGSLYVTEQQDNLIKKVTPAPEKKIVKTTNKTTNGNGPAQNQQPIANPPMKTYTPTQNGGYPTMPSSPAVRTRRNG